MDKELIEHIKEKLNVHEETYAPGAWERFAAQEEKKKKRFILWPLWSAAALILIFSSLYMAHHLSDQRTKLVISKTKTDIKNNIDSNLTEANKIKQQKSVAQSNIKNEPKIIITQQENLNKVVHNEVPSENTIVSSFTNENVIANQNQLASVNQVNIGQDFKEKNFGIVNVKKKASTKLTFEELLTNDSFNDRDKKTVKNINSKWEPGVFIAPSIGNDNKVKMNYGFSLSYNIAKNISVSSGVAYSALSTTENAITNPTNAQSSPSTGSGQAFSTGQSKSLESIDANVRGINVPLEFKYKISDKLYTGIGVSAFAILNNKLQNNYVVSQAENRTFFNASGFAEQKILIVSEKVSEPQSESVAAPEKYLGFYNFSLGYKQKLSPKKSIAVEPFLRVPMKNFSKDNLNLTNGGLRLKLDF